MNDYTAFDAKLLARIKESPATFSSLSTHMDAEAQEIATYKYDAFRVTDRRLQAMRKRGLIEYSAKTGWSAKAQKEQA